MGDVLVSGGKDGKIILYDLRLKGSAQAGVIQDSGGDGGIDSITTIIAKCNANIKHHQSNKKWSQISWYFSVVVIGDASNTK